MKILLLGRGNYGTLLSQELEKSHEVAAFATAAELPDERFDALIDFSHPSNLEGLLAYLAMYPTPAVIATTGFDEGQLQAIQALATQMPLIQSGNFSVGITVMKRVVGELAAVLGEEFDIEIIEKHHRQKLDAPSGTAKMLFESMNTRTDLTPVYGRQGETRRAAREVGIHSLRAGGIVGEHEVLFAGAAESLSVVHQAQSKLIFIQGAIRAMNWLLGQPPGSYSMEDVLFGGSDGF